MAYQDDEVAVPADLKGPFDREMQRAVAAMWLEYTKRNAQGQLEQKHTKCVHVALARFERNQGTAKYAELYRRKKALRRLTDILFGTMSNEGEPPGHQSCTVFVGGISWKAEEATLKEFFEEYGEVLECKIIVDRATGKSKGYGFVTFADPSSALSVKQATDLTYLGKTMNVGEAYRKYDRRGGHRDQRPHQHFQGGAPGGQYYGSGGGGMPYYGTRRRCVNAQNTNGYQGPYVFTPGYGYAPYGYQPPPQPGSPILSPSSPPFAPYPVYAYPPGYGEATSPPLQPVYYPQVYTPEEVMAEQMSHLRLDDPSAPAEGEDEVAVEETSSSRAPDAGEKRSDGQGGSEAAAHAEQ